MSEKKLLSCVNPATGERFDQIPATNPEAIPLILDELRHNFNTWSRKSVRERVWALNQFKIYLIDHADEIAAVLNRNAGKTMQDGLIEVFITVDNLSRIIRHSQDWLGQERVSPGLYFFKRYYQTQVPYGTVAVIGPWNYPFVQVMTPILAALAAGNTVVLKPSEITPAVGQMIDDLFAHFPDLHPYFRVVHGGPDVGAALVAAEPDLIFLTGSVGTAQKIAAACSEHLIPLITELGGKDPMIVLEDANITEAARWGVWGANYNSGQVCMSVERVYVVEAVYDQFVEAAVAAVKQFKFGYSLAKDSPYDSGPLTCTQQLDIVKAHVADALAGGARALCGARHDGLFYEPTILVDVNPSMKVMREETFGPVMPIIKVRDEEEAIRLANDSEYGLCAYVWSSNLRRAERIAHRLEAGTVVVNDAMAHYAVSALPFGGVKKSGSGRIHGRQEVLQFTQSKGIAIGPPPLPFDIATVFRRPGQYENLVRVMKLVFGNGRQKTEVIFPPRSEPAVQPRPAFNPRINGLARGAAVAATAAAALAIFAAARKK